jgi:peptide/nickel transport system permease protein
MRNYIIRRLVSVPLMLIGLSLLLFLLLWVRPGSAAFGVAGGLSLDTDFERLEERMGLNKPWYEQYGMWLGKAVQGDFGNSLVPPQNSVTSQISGRVGNTIEIGLLTIIISAVIGIPIGIISAVKRNSKLDVTLRTITILGISVPNFWTATLLLVLPAKFFGWTPLSTDFSTFGEDPIKNLSIVIWPAIILAYSSAAYTARLVRSSMLEVFYSDYVRTARAKGLVERIVVLRHAFRNSLIPVLTVIGLQLGVILGGAVIAEQIFAIPGIGLLTYKAYLAQDYTVVLGTVMMFALLFVLVNLLVDLLYTVVDPRIRY